MAHLYTIISWLLNAWFYVLTFGAMYTLVSLCCMIAFLFYVLRLQIVPTVFLSIFSSLWAPLILGLVVIHMGTYFQIPYVQTPQELPHLFVMGFVVSVIYALLQALFFSVVSLWVRYSVLKLSVAALMSNSVAAACVSFFYTLQ